MTVASASALTMVWTVIALFTVIAANRIAVWGLREQQRIANEMIEALKKMLAGQ